MARNMTRAKLVEAAKELNEVLRINPTINIEGTVEELKEEMREAIDLIRETDTITPPTQKIVAELVPEKAKEVWGSQPSAAETEAPAEPEAPASEPEAEETGGYEPAVETPEVAPAPPAAEPVMANDEAPVTPAAAEAVGGVEGADAAMSPQRRRMTSKRYLGSQAEKWDNALTHGGTWQELAEQCGIKPGHLRAHAKWSEKKGFYRIVTLESGDGIETVRAEWLLDEALS